MHPVTLQVALIQNSSTRLLSLVSGAMDSTVHLKSHLVLKMEQVGLDSLLIISQMSISLLYLMLYLLASGLESLS